MAEVTPILCFGEALWDALPGGIMAGGAPLNVAYHLGRLGTRAVPVSAVGNDLLGEALLRRLAEWGLETQGVVRVEDRLTCVVRVLPGPSGPRYEIPDDTAWDHLVVPDPVLALAGEAQALIWGTLALRSASNRQQLANLFRHSPRALKVLDVNLRPPYDAPEIAWAQICRADLVKLNHEELDRLVGRWQGPDTLEDAARELSMRAGCALVCVTAGPRGAGLLRAGEWLWEPAHLVEVVDTVGAGDAFLAALVQGLVEDRLPVAAVLARACRLAELVASSVGATPGYTVSPEGFQRTC